MALPQNALTIWNDLIAAGATPFQAAGIMGNIEQESGGNPESRAMDSNGRYANGLVSWNEGSYPNSASMLTGNPTQDIKTQIAYLIQTGGLTAAGNAQSASAAAINFQNNYERCGTCNTPNRVQSATDVFNAATSGNWNSGAATPATGTALADSSTNNTSPACVLKIHYVFGSTCIWTAGYSRALLGGLLIASGGLVALVALSGLVGKRLISDVPGVAMARRMANR